MPLVWTPHEGGLFRSEHGPLEVAVTLPFGGGGSILPEVGQYLAVLTAGPRSLTIRAEKTLDGRTQDGHRILSQRRISRRWTSVAGSRRMVSMSSLFNKVA